MTPRSLPSGDARPAVFSPGAGAVALHTARRAAACALPYAATAALLLAIGLPTVILPFWSDNAIFALVGGSIAEGGSPYVDAWDQKPPAIYLIYAVAIHGPYDLFTNVRAFDLGWTVVTAWALIALGRRWWSPRAGMIAGLLYGGVYLASSTWTQLAQPDSFIGLPLVLALLLCHAARGRWTLLVTAGAMLGFAFQLRAIMVLLVPFVPLVEVEEAPRGGRARAWAASMVRLGAGFICVQVALALYLAVGGALGQFLAATRFAAGYTRVGGPWQGPEGPTLAGFLQAVRFSFLDWALSRLVLTAPALVGGFVGAFVLRERRVQQLVLFVALAYAGIAAQAKFFWYHYWYMLPFLALLAGWAWDRALGRLLAIWSRGPAVALAGLVFAGLLLDTPEVLDTGWGQWQRYVRYQQDPAYRERFGQLFRPTSEETARYVRERTRPGEAIEVWGYDPLLYLLAERPHASRFLYALPLMSDWAPPSWRDQFMAEMRADPPVYFIAQHGQGGPWIVGHTVDPADYIDWLPELRAWLNETYELETRIGEFVLYRRRE